MLDEEPEIKLRGPSVEQPVPVGVYEIYVLGGGDADETTFKSPRKTGQCHSDWLPTLLEPKGSPRQYGAFRLTTVKIELDWVPAPCEACRKTTVSEP